MDSVKTFVEEADAFTRRHRDLSEPALAAGGTAWGMMRTIAECPDHPGVFRRPLDDQWLRLLCPADQTVWERPA